MEGFWHSKTVCFTYQKRSESVFVGINKVSLESNVVPESKSADVKFDIRGKRTFRLGKPFTESKHSGIKNVLLEPRKVFWNHNGFK